MAAPSERSDKDSRNAVSTSRSLIVRVKDQQTDAWERLVDLYAPLVYFWCRRSNVPADDANDLVQEVFQSVAINISKFRKKNQGDTFRGWLRVITRNKVADHFRRQSKQGRAEGGTDAWQRMLSVSDPDAAPVTGSDDGADFASDDDESKRILFRTALKLIRDEFRENTWEAFWGVVVDGRATGDVASDLGMSSGAVRVAKSRVLHRLRAELDE